MRASVVKKETLQNRNNAFDAVRIVAAVFVMLLHFTGLYRIYGMGGELNEGIRAVVDFFTPVVLFFSISGYLTAASCERTKSTKEYFRKRLFRIYPELWVSAFANMLMLVVLARDRLDKSFIVWIGTQVLGLAYTPGCLKEFASGSANGVLWTVAVLLQLYVLIRVFYRQLRNLTTGQWLILIAALEAVNLLCYKVTGGSAYGTAGKIIERLCIPYMVWFAVGAMLYFKGKNILTRKGAAAIFAVCFGVRILTIVFKLPDPGYYSGCIKGLCSAFAAVAAAYMLPPVTVRKDITYGLYLNQWMILNLLIYTKLMGSSSYFLPLAVYLAATVLISIFTRFAAGRITPLLNRLIP